MVAIYMWTGNPFVDAGISAILALSNKSNPQEIVQDDLQKITDDKLIPLFLTENWKKSLFSIFPNNIITNPSIKNKPAKLKESLALLINAILPLETKGNCIACGGRPAIQAMTKTDIPLTGSGSLRNYFSYASEGADYCSACAFAVQCIPFVLYACGGKFLLLHSNTYKVVKYFSAECIKNIEKQIASQNHTGCFNEKYTNPTNALFHIAKDIIIAKEEKWSEENISIRIYHFTNYNQGPELDFYDLPAPVFHFLANISLSRYSNDWKKIVQRGYFFQKKGERIPISIKEGEEEKYQNSQNQVYLNLLDGNSILRFFIDFPKRSVYGDWSMLVFYLKEVLQMNEGRINTIKNVADKIAQIIQKLQNGRKRLGQLERASTYASFRLILLHIIHDNLDLKEKEPVFTLEEYMNNLFPEGPINWKETQDLILFRLYEVLHSWLMNINAEEEDDESSVSDEENN